MIPFEPALSTSRLGEYVPWIPIALSKYGAYAIIQQEKSFIVFMAVEPSALRSAQTINVKLVN